METTDAPLLHTPLDADWTYRIAVLADRVARRMAAIVAAETRLSLAQWRVIAALADRPGRLAREVVAMTPMDKGAVSRAVAALEAAGLVRREAHPSDARAARLFLTEAGQDACRRIVAAKAADPAAQAGLDDPVWLARLEALLQAYDAPPERDRSNSAGLLTGI